MPSIGYTVHTGTLSTYLLVNAFSYAYHIAFFQTWQLLNISLFECFAVVGSVFGVTLHQVQAELLLGRML
jgi:hypothetical protein